MHDVRESRLDLPTVDLAYLEAGDPGAPLALCLHGFPDHARSWATLLPALADSGYHAVAPWLRGYAPSGLARDGVHDAAAAVADARGIVERLGAGRPAVLVGHDWGAAVTYGLAAARPDLVARAVTMSVPHPASFAPHLLADYDQQKRSWYMFVFQLPGLGELIAGADDLSFLERLVTDWSPGWLRTDADRAGLREALGDPARLGAALDYYRASLSPAAQSPAYAAERVAMASPVSVPVRLLFGADDGCISPGVIGDQTPFCTGPYDVEIVDGVGHFLLQEAPERVVPPILDRLAAPAQH